jgi:hypothetical protein
MPTEVPEETYLSLNQVARCLGMERQEFRLLVKEFEDRAGKLPTRLDDRDQMSRRVPEDFLHIFEEAYLWMCVHHVEAGDAMARALHMHRSGYLTQLAQLVDERPAFIELPKLLRGETKKFEEQTKKLNDQVVALISVATTPQKVQVDLLNQQAHIEAIRDLGRRTGKKVWMFVAVALVSSAVGALGGSWHTSTRFSKLNDWQYQTDQQLNRIERQVKIRTRP